MPFDARTAKLLAPGAHLTIDESPGLRLEATASNKTWTYRYKSPVTGNMRQIKIGHWPAMSPAAATAKWEELRSARDAGRDPAAEKRAAAADAKVKIAKRRSGDYTVGDICDFYLEGHVDRNRKEKGAKETRRTFATMLGPFANKKAETITRGDAFGLLEQFTDIPVQCANLRRELGAAWDYALDAGRLPGTSPNWWRLIMRGKLRSKGKQIDGKSIGVKKRTLSEAELAILIPWLPNFSRTVCDVLEMYLWTAARGVEICAMEVTEISDGPDGLWWTIPKEKTKNARYPNATDHRVPLFGRAAAVVRRRLPLARGGNLFPAQGKDFATQQKMIQTKVWMHQPYSSTRPEMERPRLPVTHWAPHDLRRTSRTLLAALGCPGEVAEAILGHMPPGIVGVYNQHRYDKEKAIWLEKLSEHLELIARKGA